MTKKHSTKRALIASALSLLLCVSMLVGTTFAWFTDSVTSGRNVIQSGNLDVELYYSVLDANGNWTNYAKVTKDTKIFDYNLWEPGYTQVAKFKIVNEGSLALKYQLTADVYTETLGKTKDGADIKLSDYIKYGVTEDLSVLGNREAAAAVATNSFGSFEVKVASLEKDAEAEVGMVIAMPTTVGNEANHNGTDIPSIEFGINLLASQYTAESDSFNNQYDVGAFIQVTPDNFEEVLANLKDNDQLYLKAGTYKVSANNKLRIEKDNVTIVGAGVNSTIIDAEDKACSGQAGLLVTGDNITIANLTVKTSSADNNVAALKVTSFYDDDGLVHNFKIENVALEGAAGHGLNLHGVDKAVVNNVEVRSFAKCGIAFAKATNVTVTNTKTAYMGWAGVGCMYKPDDTKNEYNTSCSIMIGAGNDLGKGMYSERPNGAPDGKDTVTFADPSAWVMTETDNGWLAVPSVAKIGTTGYATLQDAIDAAEEGNTVLVLDGTYDNLSVTESGITIKGSENVIFTGLITVATGADNVVLENINLNYQGETLPNPAYGNVEIWGDNCTLKNCDFVAKYNPNDAQVIGRNFGMVRFNYGLNGIVENCTFKTNTMGMFPTMKAGKITGCTFEPIDERRALAINCTDMWGVEISNNTFYGLRILTNGNDETFTKNKFLNYTGTIFVNSYIGTNVDTTIDLSDNYFGENPNFDQLLGTDGKVVVYTYYTDEAMTNLVTRQQIP